jgi:hypothetical protein
LIGQEMLKKLESSNSDVRHCFSWSYHKCS